MTIRLQKPYGSRGVGALYTGGDEDAVVAIGSGSYIAGTAAGTGPAAPTPPVRLTSPVAGQGVGVLYLGASPLAVVAAGLGYFEATVGAGTPGGTPAPTITAFAPSAVTAGAADDQSFVVSPPGTAVTIAVTRGGQPDTLAAHNYVHDGFGRLTSTGAVL